METFSQESRADHESLILMKRRYCLLVCNLIKIVFIILGRYLAVPTDFMKSYLSCALLKVIKHLQSFSKISK